MAQVSAGGSSLEAGIQNMLGSMPTTESTVKGGFELYRANEAAKAAGQNAAVQQVTAASLSAHDQTTVDGQTQTFKDIAKVSPQAALSYQKSAVQQNLQREQIQENVAKMGLQQIQTLAAKNTQHLNAANNLITGIQSIQKMNTSPEIKDRLIRNAQHDAIQREVQNGVITPDDAAKMPIGSDPATIQYYAGLAHQSEGYKQTFDQEMKIRQQAVDVAKSAKDSNIMNPTDNKPHVIEHNPVTGKSVDLGVAQPRAKSGFGAYQSSVNLRYASKVMGSIDEVVNNDLPVFASIKPQDRFWVPQGNETPAQAFKKATGQELASSQADLAHRAIAGFAKAIGTIESGGQSQGVTDTYVKELEQRYAIPAGSDKAQAMNSLAMMRGALDAHINEQTISGMYNGAQVEKMKEFKQKIDQMIPYTVSDLQGVRGTTGSPTDASGNPIANEIDHTNPLLQ